MLKSPNFQKNKLNKVDIFNCFKNKIYVVVFVSTSEYKKLKIYDIFIILGDIAMSKSSQDTLYIKYDQQGKPLQPIGPKDFGNISFTAAEYVRAHS